jgi:D-ribose pyranose/furanose isomerase RbsD
MRTYFQIAVAVIALFSCKPGNRPIPGIETTVWKSQLDSVLPLLGHRNWVIIADKAFPLQSAPGMIYINTDATVPEVAEYTIQQLNKGTYVSPVLYLDKELSFVPGTEGYRDTLQQIFKGQSVQTLLHDSVFAKMDKTAGLFKVVVLKTNTTLAYSSVFINLDCKYWSAAKEQQLREVMKTK